MITERAKKESAPYYIKVKSYGLEPYKNDDMAILKFNITDSLKTQEPYKNEDEIRKDFDYLVGRETRNKYVGCGANKYHYISMDLIINGECVDTWNYRNA